MILRAYSALNITKSSNDFAQILKCSFDHISLMSQPIGSDFSKSYYLILFTLFVDLVNFHFDACSSTPFWRHDLKSLPFQ